MDNLLKLSDYFQPLNLFTLSFTFASLLFFDIVGFFINHHLIKNKSFLRPINWLFGLGVYIFIWFIIHFFLPFRSQYVLVSALPFFLIALPTYFKHQGLKSLKQVVVKNPLPLLIVAPLLPAVFVKASLPPYYFDEMAYHYLSPIGLKTVLSWDFFRGGLYQNLPRLLNTLYYLVFAVTKTYSPARLLHFCIFFTTFYSISLWIRKNISLFASLAFIALYFYLPQELIMPATLGYVDIGAVSLVTLAVVTLIDFLINHHRSSLLAAALLWGLAAGTKYTTVVPLVCYFFVSLVFIFVSNKLKKKRKLKIGFSTILLISGIFLISGGYWYLKNLILFHSPTYPFVFSCIEKFSHNCQTGLSFFSSWTIPINLKGVVPIFKLLMANSKGLAILFIANILLLFRQKNKKIRRIIILIFSATALEFLIMKFLSGFFIRYVQYLQMLLMFAMCIQLVSLSINNLKTSLFFLFSTIFLLFLVKTDYRTLRFTYSLHYIPKYETEYALGKIDIYRWIEIKFSRMKDFIFFCENPPNGKVFKHAQIDPDLIWFEFDGMMRVFMTNCIIQGSPDSSIGPDQIIKYAVDNQLEFYFPTINPCTTPDKIRTLGYENEQQMQLRKVTNEIVCHSQEIIPYLYYFNWQKTEFN